jgi:hypothetical protein
MVASAKTAMKRLKARVIDASGLRAMLWGFKLRGSEVGQSAKCSHAAELE